MYQALLIVVVVTAAGMALYGHKHGKHVLIGALAVWFASFMFQNHVRPQADASRNTAHTERS
jgi:F0F1-type ATP synthase assembly protein I